MQQLISFLIASISFLPLASLLLFNVIGGDFFSTKFLLLKDVVIFLLLLIYAAYLIQQFTIKIKYKYIVILIFVYFVCLVFNAIVFYSSLAEIVLNMRRAAMHLIVFLLFIFVPLSSRNINAAHKTIVLVSWAVCLFGFVEYILPDSFWNDFLNIAEYWSTNKFDPWAAESIFYSGRFYSWDLFLITGEKERRMVSTYLEPTTLSAFLSFAFIYLNYGQTNKSVYVKILISMIFICGILTLSKGFLLSFISAWLLFRIKLHPYAVIILSLLVFYLAAAFLASYGITKGAFSHVNGYYTAVNYLLDGNLFGKGLGSAGNYGNLADKHEGIGEAVGGESGLGNMLAQTGVAALLFVIIIGAICSELVKINSHISRSLNLAMMAWFLTFIYSASSLGISGNVYVFIFSGIYLSHFKIRRKANKYYALEWAK